MRWVVPKPDAIEGPRRDIMPVMNERGLLITGAGGFLGAEVARHWASLGNTVVLVDSARGRARVEQLAAEIGPRASTVIGDITDAESWRNILNQATGALSGPPAAAALVAGAWQGGDSFHESGDAVWEAMIDANLETVRRAFAALLPPMVARGSGSIVVVGARPGVRPWTGAGSAAYTAAKAGVLALTQAVAAEVLERGVRINAVLPSTMDTPANRKAMPDVDPTKWVSLSSVAGVIGFLLSDAAKDVSGALVPVYGRS
ncbi:MAG TPA: SDR family NAD(P)-dependent oxidoreductase [Polyangia bacterium]